MPRIRFALLLTLCWMAQGWVAAAAQPVPPLALTPEQLATLPQHQATLTYGNPPAAHGFEGPLLWDVLTASGTIDPARHAEAVRQTVLIRGADGYTALLAMGEIAPDFGGREIILAITADGTAIPLPRAIIPGDRRAGRSVRDVVGVAVDTLPATIP